MYTFWFYSPYNEVFLKLLINSLRLRRLMIMGLSSCCNSPEDAWPSIILWCFVSGALALLGLCILNIIKGEDTSESSQHIEESGSFTSMTQLFTAQQMSSEIKMFISWDSKPDYQVLLECTKKKQKHHLLWALRRVCKQRARTHGAKLPTTLKHWSCQHLFTQEQWPTSFWK